VAGIEQVACRKLTDGVPLFTECMIDQTGPRSVILSAHPSIRAGV